MELAERPGLSDRGTGYCSAGSRPPCVRRLLSPVAGPISLFAGCLGQAPAWKRSLTRSTILSGAASYDLQSVIEDIAGQVRNMASVPHTKSELLEPK